MRDRIRSAIRREPVLASLFELAASRGDRVYLVGGTLRDLALERVPADWDLAAERPYELASAAAEALGRKVVSLGKEATPTYRIPLQNSHLDVVGLAPGGLEEDLRRRDFTVNALAFDPVEDRVVDPTGGLEDLSERRLRAASREAFLDDPLRVAKAFRMLALLPGFALEPHTRGLLESAREGLADVPAERVQQELAWLLEAPAPAAAVREMHAAGVLLLIFPELRPLKGLAQNRYHHADALEHTLETLQELDGGMPWAKEYGLVANGHWDWVALRLAALLHDAGKAKTRTLDASGEVHFYGHPKVSAELARGALKRLRFSGELNDAVALLALHHLRPLALSKTAPRRTALRRLVRDMGGRLPLLLALAVADKRATKGEDHDKNLNALKEVCAEALEVARKEGEELRHLPKLVDGLEALDLLGMARPGPDLGRALDALMERQVSGDIVHRDQAVAFLRSWAAARRT